MKTLTTLFIFLLGLAYHFEVSPRLEQAQKRAQLCQHWNEVNEAKQDQSGVFYSSSGVLDQTLVIHLSPSSGTINQDKILDEVLTGDEQSGEMRGLGFNQIQCGNRVVRLHGASPRPAVAIASRVPKPVNQNRVAGHSFETTYSWYGSARELLLPGLAPIRE
jgi:hypothetical protein